MEPCADCVDPARCTGTWPDDDPHRPGQVRGCFADKTRSLKLGTLLEVVHKEDRARSDDLAAYKRLVKDHGLQPQTVTNCRLVEKRAETREQVESWRL